MELNLGMNETDYKSLSITELVKQISPSSPVIEELTKRGVIRNRNYTGNIGEYFAIDFFNNFNSEIYTKTKELPKLFRSDENSQILMQKMKMEKVTVSKLLLNQLELQDHSGIQSLLKIMKKNFLIY